MPKTLIFSQAAVWLQPIDIKVLRLDLCSQSFHVGLYGMQSSYSPVANMVHLIFYINFCLTVSKSLFSADSEASLTQKVERFSKNI